MTAVDPRTIPLNDLHAALRRWAATQGAPTQAAIHLLITHDHWLRDPQFLQEAVTTHTDDTGALTAHIDWSRAYAQLWDDVHPADESYRAVLYFACDLARAAGTYLVKLRPFDHQLVVEAFTASTGDPR